MSPHLPVTTEEIADAAVGAGAANERLRKAVADLTLDKLILSEVTRGNYFAIRGSWVNSVF